MNINNSLLDVVDGIGNPPFLGEKFMVISV